MSVPKARLTVHIRPGGRTLIQDLLRKMSPVKAHGFRSVVGHYIAGTVGAEELRKALDEIE